MYGFVKRAEMIPLSVYRFLADTVVKGELSIPQEWLLQFEEKVVGTQILADTANRLRPEN